MLARVTSPPAPLPALTLVQGPEELLVERAVAAARRAVRAVDPEADVHDLAPGELEPGRLVELTSPSLFAEHRLVVVRGAHELTGPALAAVEALIADPPEDVGLVLVHPGGARGKALLDTARRAGAVVVDCAEVKKPGDRVAFVRAEFRRAGRRVGPAVPAAVLEAVGGGLRELAAACSQLVADTVGEIDAATVRRYYAGRAEVTGFTVADAVMEGRTAEALAHLRWAFAAGVDPVPITTALAMGVRAVIKVSGAPRGLRPADVARELGMPPWQVDRARRQQRGWDDAGLARAMGVVAAADAAVKGGQASARYALEHAVVAMTAARGGP